MSEKNTNVVVDVQEFIDQHRVSPFQFGVMFLCFLIIAFDGYDTAAMGFIAPTLRHAWGLSPAQLNPVLVASLCGLGIGAFASGPLADRYGRKKVLLASVTIFGGWSLVSAFSTSIDALTLMRFLTGMGLGAAMPNAVTLTSEFCPQRHRSVMVTTMFCGFTLGSASGGLAAVWLIPAFGWQGVLAVGGALPLLCLTPLTLMLPESVRFLTQRQRDAARIAACLRRIGPMPGTGTPRFVHDDDGNPAAGASTVRQILSGELRLGTLMLWATFFTSMLIIAVLTSWLPTLFREAGYSLGGSAKIASTFQIGGTVGAIVLGWMMDRFNPYRVLAGVYFVGVIAIAAVAALYREYALLILCVGAIGFCVSGGQVGANALAAAFYPTASRATGVSWALGVGRIGSIFGSLAGGSLLGMGLQFSQIFNLMTIPALIASTMVFIMGFTYTKKKVIAPLALS